MSLRVWLPLNGSLENKGLDDITVTNNGATIDNNGKIGKCYSFNGSNSGINVTGNTIVSLSAGDFSIAFWIYNDDQGDRSIYLATITPTDFGLGIEKTVNEGLRIYWQGNPDYYPSFLIPVQEWCHITVVIKNSNCYCYKNGTLTAFREDGSFSSNKITNIWEYIMLGRDKRTGNTVYKGKMNDVRIYDHALSPLEIKQISQGLILHYPLNRGGFGQENFILESHKVTSGGQGSGITRTYESDGSVKIVSTSDNGNYASLGFAQNSNTNVGNNMAVGDVYCISCDTKIESGTKLPTLFINSGNGYKQLKPVNGSIVIGKWMRVYYTSTWANPGTNYGNIGLHLGFGDAIGTYYFKNFKLEKGSIPTPWCPNSTDELANKLGLNNNVEYDTSGFGNNGTKTGTFNWTSNTPKYAVSQVFNGTDNAIQTPSLPSMISDKNYTIAVWIYKTVIGSKSYQTIYGGPSGFEIEARNGGANETKFVPWNWGKPMASYELNEWNHCVFVHSDSDCKIYLNGEYIATGTAKAANPSGNYFVGAWNTATQQNFDGLMSDFRIYATALSAEDVKDLYELGATIDTNGTLSTYEFAEQ